jgi:hypothetical protein
MGYSGRYHTASLAAVFLALAIGILIGIGLGDEVVSTASEELEQSLRTDLDDAEAEVDRLDTELGREREFGSRALPTLVNRRLANREIALIGLGSLPSETAADVEAAIEPAGGRVGAVAVVQLPPDAEALADAAGRRFAGAARGGDPLERLGEALGAELAGGGPLLSRAGDTLFSRFSGSLERVEDIVVLGAPGEDLDEEAAAEAAALRNGLLAGIASGEGSAAGAERTDTSPTTLEPVSQAGISTIDHVDLVAGAVSLVFSLAGANGDFGTKEGADSLLPELLRPAGPEQ